MLVFIHMAHCFVMTWGGLDTVHTMQIVSDSAPDKYFEEFYHKNPYF
jgi:hypothetical protein